MPRDHMTKLLEDELLSVEPSRTHRIQDHFGVVGGEP